jgi:hypothetical protein
MAAAADVHLMQEQLLTSMKSRFRIESVMFVLLSSSCLSSLSYRLSAAALAGLDSGLV